jgi:hypothetical protein
MSFFNYNGINIFYEVTGNGGECIILIHGLGSSSRVYSNISKYDFFRKNFNVLFIDLVGYGDSDKPMEFDYSIKSQALACLHLIDYLGINSTHIIAHSMGGVVAQYICESMKVKSFINCEGNLTLDDCKLSASIYDMGFEVFNRGGFKFFKKIYRTIPFYESLCMTNAYVMYESSKSLVEVCKTDNIPERFIKLDTGKMYVYGERNLGKRKSQDYLRGTGIAIKHIKDSGHNMIDENPYDFYETLIKFFSNANSFEAL